MTMQDKIEGKFKILNCGNCDKYMGYKNVNHQIFDHDFFCSLKCIDDWQTKQKVKDFQVEHLKK